MKFILLLLVLAGPAIHAEAVAKDRLKSLRESATAFYTALRAERISGLPSEAQLQLLSPLITPELRSLVLIARDQQQTQIQKHPDEKPDWIEGDLFGSLFEGVKGWELGDAEAVEGADATVEVKLTYSEPQEPPVSWTDTLVFRQSEQKWLLDDIRMGGEWELKSDDSLRGRLPGGTQEDEDHVSPDERWQVKFQRDDRDVTGITIQPVEGSSKPQYLFGEDRQEICPFPTCVIWSPNHDMIAVRLGDSPRFSRSLLYRLDGEQWKAIELPEIFPQERKALDKAGYHERHRRIDAERWQDANTLAVRCFCLFTKNDEAEAFNHLVSIAIDAKGKPRISGAVKLSE